MELRLYQRLKAGLLDSLAPASERHDPAYQRAVEAYAGEAETGVAKWGREAVQRWLTRYNQLVNRPMRLRYYQILALYFTEGVVRAWSDPAPGNWLAGIEILLCLLLFTACAMHVRLRLAAAKASTQPATEPT